MLCHFSHPKACKLVFGIDACKRPCVYYVYHDVGWGGVGWGGGGVGWGV